MIVAKQIILINYALSFYKMKYSILSKLGECKSATYKNYFAVYEQPHYISYKAINCTFCGVISRNVAVGISVSFITFSKYKITLGVVMNHIKYNKSS